MPSFQKLRTSVCSGCVVTSSMTSSSSSWENSAFLIKTGQFTRQRSRQLINVCIFIKALLFICISPNLFARLSMGLEVLLTLPPAEGVLWQRILKSWPVTTPCGIEAFVPNAPVSSAKCSFCYFVLNKSAVSDSWTSWRFLKNRAVGNRTEKQTLWTDASQPAFIFSRRWD